MVRTTVPLTWSLLALAATPGHGQSLWEMLGQAHVTAVSSSMAWVRGRDGKMHQEVQQVRSDVSLDGSRVREEIACRDGLCKETVIEEDPESATPVVIVAQITGGRIGGFLHRVSQGRLSLKPAHNNVQTVADATRPMPSPLEDAMTELVWVYIAGFCASMAAFGGAVLAILGCLKSRVVSARETPLQPLAQPLADVENADGALFAGPRTLALSAVAMAEKEDAARALAVKSARDAARGAVAEAVERASAILAARVFLVDMYARVA